MNKIEAPRFRSYPNQRCFRLFFVFGLIIEIIAEN
jgi:hypothetical protein